MRKILITGGLGYIGTEIIKIYNSRKDIICVLDKKKPSLKQKRILKKKGIKFIRADISKINSIPKKVIDYDIIIHLAAITKVPKLKKEASKKIDNEILKVGIIGTKNLIKKIKKHQIIIFPSTHLVFEKTKKNIEFNERSKPMPNLAYSTSKLQGEKIIKKSSLNYFILRLGSVYGYIEDEKRMFNMPNLFPKLVKKNQNLKLFSNGIQLKSIVSVNDVARCMLFCCGYNRVNQIFNVVSENLTTFKIANMCKRFNKKVKLILTDDLIPNPGYSMSSKKIKRTGFKFKFLYKNFLRFYFSF
tara:strand:+ start:160 stop:1062 length:903 start_codon:yes stop_codon:yes gene_type:complete